MVSLRLQKGFRIATAIFIFSLLTIWVLADSGIMPGFIAVLYAFPGGDLVGHFCLMGLFALLVNGSLAWKTVHLGRYELLLGSLGVAVLVLIEEISQAFFQTRTFSLLDLSASCLGIFILGRMSTIVFLRSFPNSRHVSGPVEKSPPSRNGHP